MDALTIEQALRQEAIRRRWEGAHRCDICEALDRSPRWFSKWWAEYQQNPQSDFADHSRAPKTSPTRLAAPLILGTTLSVATLQEARAIIRLYEKRWVIETSFEMMKGALGLEQFIVRQWQATERLLNLVAIAYTALLLLLQSTQKNVQVLLAQAERVLKCWAAFRTLTVGKLREAPALDFDENREAWFTHRFGLGLAIPVEWSRRGSQLAQRPSL